MPGPAPNSDINPLATLNATSAAVRNQADPGTIVGVANHAQSPGDAVTNIQAIVHSGNMVKMFDSLHGMDMTSQASAWGELSGAEQDSLRSLGYHPPNPDVLSHAGAGGGGGGIWGDLMGWGNDAVHDIGHVASDVPHAVSDVLNAAGAPLRAVQHGIRASYVLAEKANPGPAAAGAFQRGIGGLFSYQMHSHPGAPGESWGTIFSPSQWAQAWDETTNGNTSIDPLVHRKLIAQYGPQQVSLAINVAAEGPNAAIAAAPAGQRQALVKQVMDPKFQQLVSTVSNARISFGRMVVGQQFLNQHPEAGKLLSGGIDAATDITMDPMMSLGKGTEAIKLARFGATDASRAADIINNSKDVQRYVNRIAPALEQGRYGELGKLDPRLDSVAEELQASNIDSGAKFKDWLANKAGLRAIFNGDVAKISHQVPVVPHLSYLGWMKAGVKDALSNTVDRLADGKLPTSVRLDAQDIYGAGDHSVLNANDKRFNDLSNLLEDAKVPAGYGRIPGVSNVARLVGRVSTNVPSKGWIRTSEGEADVTNFRRWVQGFLPSKMVDDATNVFVASDEGKRRLLMASAMKQQAHAAGLYNTASGSAAADKMFAAVEEEARKQAYSVNGYDVIPDDNWLPQHHALLETQKGAGMRIILPTTMRKIVRANSIWGAAGVDPMNAIEQTMKLWRSLVLDRPGFAVRVSLDENLNRLLREGPKPFVGSFLANGAQRTATDGDIARQVSQEIANGTTRAADEASRTAALKALSYKQLIPYHPVERVLHILAGRAPEGARSVWQNLEEFYGGVLGGTTRRWARQAEGKALKAFGLNDYVEGATHLATHQPVADDALQDILASATGSEGFTLTPGSLVKALHTGADGKLAYFKQEGPFSEAAPNDPLFRFKWQVAQDQIARSKLGQAVLHSIDYHRNGQIESVLHVLNDPEFAAEKKGFAFTNATREGKLVGVDASQAEADRSFAESIVDHVNAHVREGKYDPLKPGKVIQELVDHMKETGAGPTDDLLDTIDNRRIPQSVFGPDMVEVNKFEGLLSRSFEEMTGKPMNWLGRQPHLIHQYTHALRDARKLAKDVIPDQVEQDVRVPVPDTIEHVTRTLNPDEVPESEFYHGTAREWGNHAPTPGRGRDAANLFGPGLYATDSKKLALDYTNKDSLWYQQRGKPPISRTVYGLRSTKKLRLLDAEALAPENVRSLFRDLVTRIAGGPAADYHYDSHIEDALGLIEDPHATVADLYSAFKELPAGMFDDLNDASLRPINNAIRDLGYDGIRYDGGIRAGGGKELHNAYVMFPDDATGKFPVEVSHVSTAEKTEQIVTRHPDHVVRQLVTRPAGELEADREKYASDVAFGRAVNAVIPYIHNPQLRTQFEDMHRVLFPFLFAQRQFIQRWGRTFADSPSAVRELQLGMNALRTTGIVKKDANGNDYFYYPGSQYVTEMIAGTLNQLGVHATIPFVVPFTGQVKYLMPGLANPVTPSVGPFAAVGMKDLGAAFPQMQGFNQAVLGQGAAENTFQQFLPTIANRVIQAFGPANAGSQKASAIAMMMKFMDANGQGLPQNATPGQIEQYIDRVDTGSTEIMAVRAALGFVLPATPTAGLDPQGLDARYKELLTQLPYDKALQQFYKENPHASAYTIGTTQGATAGNIPSTAADLAFTNQHVQFAKDYPAAFPWLAPRSPGQFSLTEFLEQEQTGQRTPLPTWSPSYGAKSVLANIMNAKASQQYYAAVDTYDKAYSATADSGTRKAYTQQYDAWKAAFLKRNPTFAEYLTSQVGKNEREATIQQVRQALSDPQLPDSPAVPGLKDMLQSYDTFKAGYNQYLGSNNTASYDAKVNIKNQAIAWGNDYIKSHPAVADFWNTILRPEVDEQTG